MSDFVSLDVADHVALVSFARPPINAVNLDANRQVAETFESINERDDISAVIFTSEGKGFVSGSDVGDFGEFTEETLSRYEDANVRSLKAIYHCKVPVIGAVHGYALGLGVCFAAVCDILLCSDDAFFGQPEVRLGSVGGTDALSMLMPEKFVRYMAFTGKYIGVAKIAEFGSIHAVVPREKLLDEAKGVARDITRNWTTAVQAVKCAIRDLKGHDLARDFYTDCKYTHKLLKDPRRDEVLAAYYASRKK
ncbi:MAG: enoyl-CoA hydratase/isomerase family protein [Bryobacteraceae bacterium]|nr:enoyl-CoA hydratase/isomerase family protein [Bryobacteraceae bacterium]